MRLACLIAPWLLLLQLFGLAPPQSTELTVRLSADEAEHNLVKRVAPVYAQMLKLAHVEGEVVLGIVISADGKVVSAEAVTGDALLVQPAIDAVKQWEYRPYLVDGRARTVDTSVHIRFSLGDLPRRDNAYTRYDDQESKCKALLDQQSYDAAETTCALLPGLARKADQLPQESAYDLSGYAYFKVSKFPQALSAWQRQLAVAKDLHLPDSPRLAEAYFNVARALRATGDLNRASPLYAQAESILEAAHQKNPQIEAYSENLRIMLQGHASLLRQMGNESKAEELEREAASMAVKTGPQK